MAPIQPPLYPLSILSSHLVGLSFGSSYVVSLYLVKNARLRFSSEKTDARHSNVLPGSRDDPAVIRARLTAATFATLLNCGIVYVLIARSTAPSFDSFASTLAILGVRWPDRILSCLQTPLLFLGPLYGSYLAGTLPGQSNYSFNRDFLGLFSNWQGFRNYVWGPLTEEIVFRACVLSVYAMGGASRWRMIAFAPLIFGLAHVHHAWDTYNRLGRTQDALKRAALSTIFQTLYTTLFGAHTSYLFLRTSSLIPPLTAHVFCNIMGIPQLQSETRRFPEKKTTIIAVYVIGIALFAYTLVPWTESPTSLYWRAPEAFWRAVVGTS
ncbi:putative CAAX prenyl protease 2 [Mycena venus]|uniref:intramembrane prenyl-peptidase Rce1 n=1 Tax=Mycena venus TaxID=2733690 RepID=A0A8H6X5W3_9AGAR|nr:putative CAAX prenyl protease 2 [Mycena venus]